MAPSPPHLGTLHLASLHSRRYCASGVALTASLGRCYRTSTVEGSNRMWHAIEFRGADS